MPPTNSECAAACHPGFTALSGQLCYSCHAPEEVVATWQTSAGCSQQCHLWDPAGKAWTVVYTHGAAPHNGADYLPCLNCHTVAPGPADPGTSNSRRRQRRPPAVWVVTTAHRPRRGHQSRLGHTRLYRLSHQHGPAGSSRAAASLCHSSVAHPEAKQIAFTSKLSCSAAACHGAGVRHDSTPARGRPAATATRPATTGASVAAPSVTPPARPTTTARPRHRSGDCASCHDGTRLGQGQPRRSPGLYRLPHGHGQAGDPGQLQHLPSAGQLRTGSCADASCHGAGVQHDSTPSGQDLHRLPQPLRPRPLHGPGQLHHLPHDVAGYHHSTTGPHRSKTAATATTARRPAPRPTTTA